MILLGIFISRFYNLSIPPLDGLEEFWEDFFLHGGIFNKKSKILFLLNDERITIGDSCFKGLVILKQINIPNFIHEIGNNAFFGCTSLDEITIPSFVVSIGSFSFYGCKLLTEIQNRWNFNTNFIQIKSEISTIFQSLTDLSNELIFSTRNLSNLILLLQTIWESLNVFSQTTSAINQDLFCFQKLNE